VAPAKRLESMSASVNKHPRSTSQVHFGKSETAKTENALDGETRVSQFETDNSNETLSDTASNFSAENESPFGRMLLALKLTPNYEKLVFDAQGGLTGTKIIASFQCILDGERFFVHLGDTEYTLFDKNTLFNLADVAENKGAKDFYILLDKTHPQKTLFRQMFKVIDAQHLSEKTEIQKLIQDTEDAREIKRETQFFKMLL